MPTWSRDSRRIHFQYDDQGTTRIAEADLSGRVTNLVDDLGGEGWSRPYGGGSFSVARDGTIAYSANDITTSRRWQFTTAASRAA